jgi:hypothetical protein
MNLNPLSEHARAELANITAKPVPRQAVNPGVANRLLREDLVIEAMMPSPFKTHGGRRIAHLVVTNAGRERLGLLADDGVIAGTNRTTSGAIGQP